MLGALIVLWWFATVILFAVLMRGLAGVRHARSSARHGPSARAGPDAFGRRVAFRALCRG